MIYCIIVEEKKRKRLSWLCTVSNVTLQGVREGQDAQEQAHVLEEETIIHLCQSQVLHSPTTFLKSYTTPVNTLMDTGNCVVF